MGVRNVIQAVQGAHRQIHSPRQPQLFQPLADKPGRIFQVGALVPGNGEHFLAHIHPGDLQPLPGQDPGYGTGAAGQICRRPGVQSLPGQDGIVECYGGFIVHIVGQAVIAGRQIFIGSHGSPPSSPKRPGMYTVFLL